MLAVGPTPTLTQEMTAPSPSARDLAEVARSAAEAEKIVLKPADPAQIERYLAPPLNTPYALEYAFHLLGDVQGKTVLDLGCGAGEDVIPLVRRGARVTGIDISPDLIRLAQKRLAGAGVEVSLRVGSAYSTELPAESVDVIFCMALIHHLEIPRVRDEMLRILAPAGKVILKEPIRFSEGYRRLRGLLPSHEDVSEFEHPLTRDELDTMTYPFRVEGMRFFRLPFVPLVQRVLPSKENAAWGLDSRILRRWPALERYATTVVMRLCK